jgi:VIT1/CCC1 family predicted Fe2+/Mn2+ transporter
LPLLIVLWTPAGLLIWAVAGGSLLLLVSLGAASARAGGASMLIAGMRVSFWGALAMGLTAGVGFSVDLAL